MPSRVQRWTYGALFAFMLLYAFPYQARLNNPNENVRVYMTAALVEHGTYEIDELRKRWGWVNDAATRDGHVYSVKAPGTSWLGVPGYALYLGFTELFGVGFDRTVALWVCRFTATIVPTWLWFIWLWRWLDVRTQHKPLRDAVFVSIAFGSLLYGYGMLFVSHTLSAAVAFVAFAGLYDSTRNGDGTSSNQALSSKQAFWIGLLTAAVTVLEYPGLVVSIVLVGYALWVIRWRAGLFWFGLGGFLPTLAMMHFQWSAFGSPFTPGHLMVENDAFRSAHEQGLYGAVGPSWSSLHGLLFDLGAGLFPLTPILVFALPGFYLLVRKERDRTAAYVAIGACLLTLLSIASMNNWRGGWTIGPRYLAVVVPFMGWAGLIALNELAARAPRTTYALAGGCALAGFVASGLPSLYYPHLPPELTRPLPQLIGMLMSHDYAPFNLGGWLGLHGTLSMVPLALALGVLCWSGYAAVKSPDRYVSIVAGLVAAAVLVAPLALTGSRGPQIQKARSFITRRWTPEGHDRAARSENNLVITDRSVVQTASYQQALSDLAETYREEGRNQEAARTDRRVKGK